MNKRFCQIIFVSIMIVILLCGSFLLPFHLLKNTKSVEILSDTDDESSSDQGNANADPVDCLLRTGHQFKTVILMSLLSLDDNCYPCRCHELQSFRKSSSLVSSN